MRAEAQGWEGRAQARTPSRTEQQQAAHLVAWLSAEERNSSLLTVHYFLILTCMTCFSRRRDRFWLQEMYYIRAAVY